MTGERELAAQAVALHGSDLPHVGGDCAHCVEVREVMEALGLIAPGGRSVIDGGTIVDLGDLQLNGQKLQATRTLGDDLGKRDPRATPPPGLRNFQPGVAR